jgi:hypothetical protein
MFGGVSAACMRGDGRSRQAEEHASSNASAATASFSRRAERWGDNAERHQPGKKSYGQFVHVKCSIHGDTPESHRTRGSVSRNYQSMPTPQAQSPMPRGAFTLVVNRRFPHRTAYACNGAMVWKS